MQRKIALLVCMATVLMSFNQAFAQSSHEAITSTDSDSKKAHNNKFEVKSPDGKYKLGFSGYLQENNKFTYIKDGEKKDVDIELNRARLSLYGTALDPRLTYLVQVGLEKKDTLPRDSKAQSRLSNANSYHAPGTDFLKDYYLNVACHPEYLQLRVGKFKIPFSRQQIMSASHMRFYNRNMANSEFRIINGGRDIGLMLHNGHDHPFEWALAAVTHGVVGRIGFNHRGINGYDTEDWTHGDLRFAIAANGFLHSDYKSTELDDVRAGVDLIAKVAGFSTEGSFYYQRLKEENNEPVNRFGIGAELGYLIKSHVEPSARYSWVKSGDSSADRHEILGGLNYYIFGHNLKLQGYGGAYLQGKDMSHWLVGAQLQFAI